MGNKENQEFNVFKVNCLQATETKEEFVTYLPVNQYVCSFPFLFHVGEKKNSMNFRNTTFIVSNLPFAFRYLCQRYLANHVIHRFVKKRANLARGVKVRVNLINSISEDMSKMQFLFTFCTKTYIVNLADIYGTQLTNK